MSEAYAKNDNTAIFDRFDGKISDHVRTILTNENYLATEKELILKKLVMNFLNSDIEENHTIC